MARVASQVVVLENFIDATTVARLRADATALRAKRGAFKTSGLTNTAAARAQGGKQVQEFIYSSNTLFLLFFVIMMPFLYSIINLMFCFCI